MEKPRLLLWRIAEWTMEPDTGIDGLRAEGIRLGLRIVHKATYEWRRNYIWLGPAPSDKAIAVARSMLGSWAEQKDYESFLAEQTGLPADVAARVSLRIDDLSDAQRRYRELVGELVPDA